MSDTETFKQIMNMEIHTLDETSINNVSKMWCFIEKQNEKIAERDKRIAEFERLIQDIYDICLCERFKTEGFDYHEKHPRRKDNNGGSRPFTPRNLIENRIGYKWEEPNGAFSAYKKLNLKTLEQIGETE